MSSDSYSLGRGGAEAERLDFQHEVLIDINQFYLHPSIVESLPANPRVADLGTGTGVWLRGLPAAYPQIAPDNWTLHGFDISGSQFPEPSLVGPNITLQEHDARVPLPAELHGQYDVVHLRLLSAALTADTVEPVARNAVALLKPGTGRLQWVEGEVDRSSQFVFGPSDTDMVHFREFLGKLPPFAMHSWHYTRTLLPEILPRLGMCEVEIVRRRTDQTERIKRDWTLVGMGAHLSAQKLLAATNTPGMWSAEVADEKHRLAKQDVYRGAYMGFEFQTFIGRRGP